MLPCVAEKSPGATPNAGSITISLGNLNLAQYHRYMTLQLTIQIQVLSPWHVTVSKIISFKIKKAVKRHCKLLKAVDV